MGASRRVARPAVTTAKSDRERLAQALESSGGGFEFTQAMRLLMRMYPERAAIGGWDDPAREVVRLSVPPSLSFPPAELAFVELPAPALPASGAQASPNTAQTGVWASARARVAAGGQARVGVRFLSLTGPQGVLPHLYTEQASARTRARDTAFRDFLDLFHHRALSLFYRAWERSHPTVASERGAQDSVHWHLLDLVGAGTEEVRARSVLPPNTLAYYASLFSMQARPAVGMAQLVADYFRIPAQIDQFVGEWQTIRSGGQLCVGDDGLDGQLGSAVVGDAIFDPMSRVRLKLGPLSRAQFDAFLPGGREHEKLRQLARFYADDQVGVDAQLILARAEIPNAQLSTEGAPRLGFGTWLRSRPPQRDADDVQFRLC